MDSADIDDLRDASQDIEEGNFVTLSRTFRGGGMIEERLITFKDVYVSRYYKHASYATPIGKGEKDTLQYYSNSN